MTIVELYDEKPINNVVGTLAFHPEKLIYVGGHAAAQFAERMLPPLDRYFRSKDIDMPEIEYVQVNRNSLTDIIAKLENIYNENEDCHFHMEVTGGEDLILVGLGVICQRHPEVTLCQISGRLRGIRQFSVRNGDSPPLGIACANTVGENLLLHEGTIISANGSDLVPDGYQWHWESLMDVETMWEILCSGIGKELPYCTNSKPNLWNRVTTLFGVLEPADHEAEVLDRLKVPKSYYNGTFLPMNDTSIFQEYVYCFLRSNLLADQRFDDDYVYFDFKDPFVRMCLTKAGLLLELKTYLICKALVEPHGGDCLTGVTIDWNGDDALDTFNEVDVMATCGLVPYFISCKNGKFDAEELYKLYSVGERFGRGYCKKIIVTTDIAHALGENLPVIRQRAAELGILIIGNVHQMTDAEFAAALSKAMELPAKVKV